MTCSLYKKSLMIVPSFWCQFKYALTTLSFEHPPVPVREFNEIWKWIINNHTSLIDFSKLSLPKLSVLYIYQHWFPNIPDCLLTLISYTYFKKGCRRDRRLVNRKRQLNERKDSWVLENSHQTRRKRQSHAITNFRVYFAYVYVSNLCTIFIRTLEIGTL